jgi:hypothetical protein
VAVEANTATDRTAEAVEAIAAFQQHWRTADEYGIADLICDLGHLAEERGFEFVSEVGRGIGIGSRKVTLKTATISGRMLQSRSQPMQGSRDTANH